jgi:hypothetical protein
MTLRTSEPLSSRKQVNVDSLEGSFKRAPTIYRTGASGPHWSDRSAASGTVAWDSQEGDMK